MSGVRRVLAGGGLLVALVPMAAAGLADPAGATLDRVTAASGPCPTPSGVTVVVDFTAVGGSVVVRCAGDAPADGWSALTNAGFAVRDTVPAQGFVCRIDQLPSEESCIGTPPADAYWSYWHAPRGGPWTYSELGARSRVPAGGSVEGWAFVTGDPQPPGIAPPAAVTPTTDPPADTPGTTDPGPAGQATGTIPASPRPSVAGIVTTPARPSTSPTAVPATPADGAPSADGTSSGRSGGLRADAADPSATPGRSLDPTDAGGSGRTEAARSASSASAAPADAASAGATPAATMATVGVVALLGGAAFFVQRRRRSAHDG